MPVTTRSDINAATLQPEALADLNDDDFRAVVNADLKRGAANSRTAVNPAVSTALRSPALRQRWMGALTVMLESVDSQLVSRHHDYEASRSDLRRQMLEAEAAGKPTTNLEITLQGITSNYHDHRARTTRFRGIVLDALREARKVCGAADKLDGAPYARRVEELESAIRLHRELVLADLDGDEPDDIDAELWNLLDI